MVLASSESVCTLHVLIDVCVYYTQAPKVPAYIYLPRYRKYVPG